jgi:hypothetical protein
MDRMGRAGAVTLLLLGGLGLAILLAWGGSAFFVFVFFAVIALLVAVGARVGGRWLEDASRGRFDRDRR